MARLTTVMRNHQLDASVLALTHELAQQIEEAMYIEVSSSQLCSSQIYFCSGPTQAFLLFLL